MAAKKSPGRDVFDPALAEISADIPPTYTALVRLFRPDFESERIQEVRKGRRVDFAVLDELRNVVKIRREAEKKYLKQ